MARVNREELLSLLESVQPGLSAKSELDQSTCLVFQKGFCLTYNGEIACRAKSILNGVEGAVHAGPLVSVLRKMPEEEIDVGIGANKDSEGHLTIVGKGRKLAVRMDAEILMPLDQLEAPGKWTTLPEEFSEALKTVQECAASGKKADFLIQCVHLMPKYLEASDNRQMIRYAVRTGLTSSALIKANAAAHVAMLGASEVSETESWVHFRSPDKVVVSCRRFVDDFKDIGQFFKDMDGDAVVLPKSLADEMDAAEVFSSEQKDANFVEVKLKPGKVRIKGMGVSGHYTASKDAQYSGPDITFYLPPNLMKTIVMKHNELRIKDFLIKVKGGKWRYVTATSVPETNEIEE